MRSGRSIVAIDNGFRLASGTMTIAGVPAIHNGGVTTATLSVPFAWTVFVGPGAMLTGPVTVTFANGGTARSDLGGVGSVSMPIVPAPSNVCPAGGPASALVTGAVAYGL